jgi:N-sulfoglucosamine sulfohydrolase
MRAPNIVYLHTHDLGRYCEPYGYAIPSPNLMRLARQGVLLRNCHSNAPSCAPSRASLVTGRYPHCCGMLGLPSEHLGYRLDDYNQHIGAHLSRHGFSTVLSGVQHVARLPMVDPFEVLPYDRFLNYQPDDPQMYQKALTIPAAIDYLQEDHDRPFFLSVGLVDPHRDNHRDNGTFIQSYPQHEPADIEERARYCRPWPHMPDNPVTRREMANFRMGVEQMDADVGRLLTVLDQPEHRAHTLVIFTTDHGPGVCEMKCTLSDRGTGVAAIFRGPTDPAHGDAALFRGGRVIDALCQQIDFYPTICDLVGRETPIHCQGRSLMPLVRGESERIHDEVFTEQTYHYSADPKPYRSIRTERYRYIYCYKPDLNRGVDRGPAETWWLEHGYGDRPVPAEQLFDLWFDPQEAHNLVGHEAYRDIHTDLRNRLNTWQRETADPILNGIPAPPAQRA